MSQKSSKRNKQRASVDEIDKSFKTPVTSAKNKEDIDSDDEFLAKIANGNASESVRQYQTRSRSNTPLTKSSPKNSEEKGEDGNSEDAELVVPKETLEVVEEERLLLSEEMVPLVMEREDDITLDLGENENDSDATTSFEELPNRCATRQSKTSEESQEIIEIKSDISFDRLPEIEEANSEEQEDEEVEVIEVFDSQPETNTAEDGKSNEDLAELEVVCTSLSSKKPDVQTVEAADFNDTSDTFSTVSTDNISTKAVAGSDVTRNIDITYQDLTFDENTYTSPSVIETYRSLSSRRTIRPINTDYRRYALRNNGDSKAEYEAVERITPGTKRKRSLSPSVSKRPKKDGSNFLSYLTSPISNFKNSFGKSSTPTLIGFEKRDEELNDSVNKIVLDDSGETSPKNWCTIM